MSVPVYDLIAFQARIRPQAPAVFCSQGLIRYRQLLRDVDAMVAELKSHGVNGPEPVALIFSRDYVHLLLIIALDRMNITSVSLLTPKTRVPWNPKDPLIVISYWKPEFEVPHRWIEIPERWVPRFDGSAIKGLPGPCDTLVRIILSSGSTGSPKAISIRRDTLAIRIAEHIRDLGLGRHSRVMAMHQLSGGPGYWTSLATLAAGGTLILLKQLDACVQYADLLKITHLSCSPYILEKWIDRSKGLTALTALQVLETAGSHLPDQVGRRAHDMVSPNVCTLYGATEAGRIAFSEFSSIANIEGAVGFVSPWCKVEIVDSADKPLEFGSEGIVRIRKAGIVDSYYQSADLTAKHLREGCFYPGDIGVMREDGLLRIINRVDDVVNLGGIKVSLVGAEETLRTVPGVNDVSVFVVSAKNQIGRLWAAIVRRGTIDEAALRQAIQSTKISRVMYVENLPRNESGKVLRRKLTEAATDILGNEKMGSEVQQTSRFGAS